MENSFEENKLERQFKLIYSNNCLKKVSEGNDNWIIGKKIAESTIEILKWHWKNWLAWMADLSEIDIKDIEKIKEGDEGIVVDIKWFMYKIVNTEYEKNLPDGNYYNLFTKKFVVKYNNWSNLLEYSPYKKTKKMFEIKTWKVFWKDNLLINWFCWQIWNVLSNEKKIDSESGIMGDYSSEYKDMVWRYDIWIWYFEWVVKNKYGSDNYVWFEWSWIFRINNNVILVWNFTTEHYLNDRKIYWAGKIIYKDKSEEVWSRGGKAKLYEKIYTEYQERGAIVDYSF